MLGKILKRKGSIFIDETRSRRSRLKDFTKPIPQALLNIEDKNRSNLFAWRGQFSPQLIECILEAYCPPDAVVLDPFVGSGTVLYEAAVLGLSAFGFEINPSAWSFSKLYEFANLPLEARDVAISELRSRIEEEFPVIIFSDDPLPLDVVEHKIIRIEQLLSDSAKTLCNALVVTLDIYNNQITGAFVQGKFKALTELVRRLPYSARQIKADLQDARALPLQSQAIDFVVTSPPYINVFNYHQNYRRSVEVLGWDLLRVARSELGSNRANRGNRFYTVVQYCIDIANVLLEVARVLKSEGRAVFIVGYESKVLGTPFYNADLVENIALQSGMFDLLLRQQRVFTNRFGEAIREDLLNLSRKPDTSNEKLAAEIGRAVALEALTSALQSVLEKNRDLLTEAVSRVGNLNGTPIFNSFRYNDYQTRDSVMMVKEGKEPFMDEKISKLPTPHLDKLNALMNNSRMIDKVQRMIDDTNPEMDAVLKKGHF